MLKTNPSSSRSLSKIEQRKASLCIIFGIALGLMVSIFIVNVSYAAGKPATMAKPNTLKVEDLPQEVHLKNVRALTHSGENAEAYFSFKGDRLVYQAKAVGESADSIWVMKTDGSGKKRISSGDGTTTCSYFLPGDNSVIYASTHKTSKEAPKPPDYSLGYVWPLHAAFDIYKQDIKTGKITQLTDSPGYDAEATVSPDGKKIVFTSMRDGDLELYSMDVDGSHLRRLTHTPGYDGGAFFSPDSKQIIFRASRFNDPKKLKEYQDLLAKGLVRPSQLEIFIMNADGSQQRQITHNGAANFAPFFHPSGKKVLFSSNYGSKDGRDFNIFMVDLVSGQQQQITFSDQFDSFPMFSPDGKKLVFGSNRFGQKRGETNVFIADWVE